MAPLRWICRLDSEPDSDRMLIGGKASSIARMKSLSLPVPPAFVVTTAAHNAFLETGQFPSGLEEELSESMAWLEAITGRVFGGGPRPLLVSVRSGAPVSMPGMMDTILNLGMNDHTEALLAQECSDPAFARDTHRRFVQLYGDIVCKSGLASLPAETGPSDWRAAITDRSGEVVPQDPTEQLHAAVKAVFESWNSRRARKYRQHNEISNDLGTAVTVQAMVFGNLDELSGTGVVFSRNPSSGECQPFGEYLSRAQGEDVVSGNYTPEPLDALRTIVPQAFDDLLRAAKVLEITNRAVQDIEFTVERGILYLLQSRAAKLAPAAAIRTSVDMVEEGLIDEQTALDRISPQQIAQFLAPQIASAAEHSAIRLAQGEGACPGVGIGTVVTDSDEAERRATTGERVVLARPTTSPHDLHGMIASVAIITEEGGSTSHAAVVSRALGRPCVVGCGAGQISPLSGRLVTVDGNSGSVYDGELPVEAAETSNDRLKKIALWAEARAVIRILSPGDAPDVPIADLDRIEDAADPAKLEAVLQDLSSRHFIGVRGSPMQSSAAIRAAAAAGLQFIVAEPPLPCLIAAAQAN